MLMHTCPALRRTMCPLLHELVTPAASLCVVCSLVNQRHFLFDKIAWLERRSTYLQGQHHQWQVVPPPGHPSANGGHPSPGDHGHLSPRCLSDDTPHSPPDVTHAPQEGVYPSPEGACHPYDEAYPSPGSSAVELILTGLLAHVGFSVAPTCFTCKSPGAKVCSE